MKAVAILGCGTVGSGVAELLERNGAEMRRRAGYAPETRYILVRRPLPESPWRDRLTADFSRIENDGDVAVVAECIGGVGAALEYDRRALLAGKSVVTSNKELVARYGLELARLAWEKRVSFLFEPSVGGGIPVLHALNVSLAANRVQEVLGVVNGTTNYILTAMERQGTDFAAALAEAQRLGYAERDPAADVRGWDAGRKACILADLSLGKNADPAEVSMEGIGAVTAADIAQAAALGRRVKLLGRALRVGDGAVVYAAPHLLPRSHPLATLDGVTNGLLLRCDAAGDVFLSGPGAGSLPTASAVVGDILDALQNDGRPRPPAWEAAPEGYYLPADALESRWYVRCAAERFGEAVRAFPGAEFAPGGCAFLTAPLSAPAARALTAPLAPESLFRALD